MCTARPQYQIWTSFLSELVLDFHFRNMRKTLSCDRVTIKRSWFDNRMYWTLWYSAWLRFAIHYYTHTHTHTKYPQSYLQQSLPGNGFQRRTFPFLSVPKPFPCLSYQLITATAHNEWTPAVLWLIQSLTNQPNSTQHKRSTCHNINYQRVNNNNSNNNNNNNNSVLIILSRVLVNIDGVWIGE
jgi:hypothetical protein